MKVKRIEGEYATVELDGVSYRAGLQLLDGVRTGDFVIVHAGFAIQKLDEKEANEIYDIFRSVSGGKGK